MSVSKIPPSRKVCLKLWTIADEASKSKTLAKTSIESTTYKRELLDERESFVPTKFVMVEPQLLASLNARALKLVAQIIKDLKENNMLWHFDHSINSRDKATISQLRKLEVLYRTEVPTIHIVNPWKIRRGKVEAVIAATSKKLASSGKLSPEMITNLANRSTSFNAYELLQV